MTEDSQPGTIALDIPADLRERLRGVAEPRYRTFKGDHITLKLGVHSRSAEAAAPLAQFRDAQAEFYGMADDGRAVQCFLVRVNGAEKDDKGRPYHLTWSIDDTAQVPGAYNRDGKPGPARSLHAAYVAGRDDMKKLWAQNDCFRVALSARFYAEKKAAPIAAPASGPKYP